MHRPFKTVLNNALKHEEKNYLCPIFSSDCPLNQKKFVQKIELGHQRTAKHLMEIGETVRVNLTNPVEFSQDIMKSAMIHIKSSPKSKSLNYGNSLLAAALISFCILLTFNFYFGIGK